LGIEKRESSHYKLVASETGVCDRRSSDGKGKCLAQLITLALLENYSVIEHA